MSKFRYMPVAVQIVGNATAWRYIYYPLGEDFPDRRAAIRAGIEFYGHDDFLLAILRHGDVLTGVAWQYEDRDPIEERHERVEMAEQCGWRWIA